MSRHRWESFGFFGSPKVTRATRVLISLVILACTVFAFDDSAIAADTVPLTRDLRADALAAAQQHRPLLLFFTLEGCPYCARVRRAYLGPMSNDPEQMKRALFREIPIEATVPDFAGKPRLGRDIADELKITIYPTVVLVDAKGQVLAPPLVGFTVGHPPRTPNADTRPCGPENRLGGYPACRRAR